MSISFLNRTGRSRANKSAIFLCCFDGDVLRGRWSDEADDLVEWGRWSIADVAKWGREARTPVKTDVGATEGEAE